MVLLNKKQCIMHHDIMNGRKIKVIVLTNSWTSITSIFLSWASRAAFLLFSQAATAESCFWALLTYHKNFY